VYVYFNDERAQGAGRPLDAGFDAALYFEAQAVFDGDRRFYFDDFGCVACERDVKDEASDGGGGVGAVGCVALDVAEIGAHLVDGERADFGPVFEFYADAVLDELAELVVVGAFGVVVVGVHCVGLGAPCRKV